MKTLTMTTAGAIACLLAGCASTPPAELRNARSAYQELAQSPAPSVAPAEVYEAKKSLDIAEQGYSQEGDQPEVRDLAYIAERKVVAARAMANAMLAMQQKQMAMADADRIRQQRSMAQRDQLGQTKEQLSMTQQQLESERLARIAAEQRTAETVIKIQGLTAKQEARGLVLTISGSVLFKTGESVILPTAQKRLDDVVMALKSDPRQITVVGHTDSVGNEQDNMDLSRKRAESVRMYLVSHGIPEDRVTTQGMGEQQPIADNKTATGRANNRRVELILQDSGKPGTAPLPGSGQQKSRTEPGMQHPSTSKPSDTTTPAKPPKAKEPAQGKPMPGSGIEQQQPSDPGGIKQ